MRTLVDILAIRDLDTGKPIQVRELTEPELKDNGAQIFELTRKKYPPPRYEVMMAVAPTMEMFLTNRPQFRQETQPQGGPSGTPTKHP